MYFAQKNFRKCILKLHAVKCCFRIYAKIFSNPLIQTEFFLKQIMHILIAFVILNANKSLCLL